MCSGVKIEYFVLCNYTGYSASRLWSSPGECSKWVKSSDIAKYNGIGERLDDKLIAIASSNPNQLLPDTLGYSHGTWWRTRGQHAS